MKYIWSSALFVVVLILPHTAFANLSYISTYSATTSPLGISTPRAMRMASDGSLYVLGSSTFRMAKFSADGSSAQAISFGASLPSTGNGLLITGSTLYITTTGTRVVRHAIVGTSTVQEITAGLTASSTSTDIAFRPDGAIYVTKGTALSALTTDLTSIVPDVSLSINANRMAMDGAGNLYYVNTIAKTIRKVTFSDNSIVSDSVLVSFAASSISLQRALFVSPAGDIYFADASSTPYISKYSSGGVLLWTYTSQAGAGTLSGMQSMTVDSNGIVYVINTSGVVKMYSQVDVPTGVTAQVSGTSVTFNWTAPTDPVYASTSIRRSTSAYPIISNGTSVATDITTTTSTDSGLADGVYYYSLFHKNANGIYSGAANALVIIDTSGYTDVCGTPYAYWKLDETGSTLAIDSSGNGFSGALYSTAPTLSSDVPANTGVSDSYSFHFTRAGSGQALQASRPVQDDFTLCAWFKTTATGSNIYHYTTMPLFESEVGGIGNDFGFGVDNSGYLAFGNGALGGVDTTIRSTSLVTTGTWTHGCASRRKANGAIAVYINGVREASGTGSTTSLNGNANMLIGAGSDGGVYWDGNIDEARIYNTVLSSDDIHALATGLNECRASSSSSSSSSSSTPAIQRGGHRGDSTAQIVRVLRSRETSAAPSSAPAPISAPVPSRTLATSSPATSQLQSRTCSRVTKWFSTDTSTVRRLNVRLMKWFGFTCGE